MHFAPARTTTCSDASRRPREHLDLPRFGERSEKGPFTSVSMEAFTKDSLQEPLYTGHPSLDVADRALFGVKGGARATPVSVGCAATNPTLSRSAPSWVTPAPPLRVHCVSWPYESHAELSVNKRRRLRMSSYIPKQPKRERDQISIKLDRDVLRRLEQYGRYLGIWAP